MRIIPKILGLVSFVALLVIGALMIGVPILGYIIGQHTEYCPPAHKHNMDSACRILDQRDGKILIVHGDYDVNRWYFEIRQNTSSSYFETPKALSGKSKIEFVPGSATTISIDGQTFDLTEYKGKK